jgi:hypothetical protein
VSHHDKKNPARGRVQSSCPGRKGRPLAWKVGKPAARGMEPTTAAERAKRLMVITGRVGYRLDRNTDSWGLCRRELCRPYLARKLLKLTIKSAVTRSSSGTAGLMALLRQDKKRQWTGLSLVVSLQALPKPIYHLRLQRALSATGRPMFSLSPSHQRAGDDPAASWESGTVRIDPVGVLASISQAAQPRPAYFVHLTRPVHSRVSLLISDAAADVMVLPEPVGP